MKITFGFASLIVVVGLISQPAPAQETMRVAIPLFPTAAFPLLVANDRGFFRNEGLTVEPIRINSAPTTYQALIAGDVHAAAGAPTGLLPSHAQCADVIAVGSWDNLVPYVWVTREKSPTSANCAAKKSASTAPVANPG
jgi:ABC-type nitrate/sulfonate/bicarbonate transport system substrate-binding protein